MKNGPQGLKPTFFDDSITHGWNRLRKNVSSVRSAFHLRASPSLLVRAGQRSQRAHPVTRMPAAARKYYFSATYGTFSLRSPMAESHGLPSRALIQVFTHEGIFPLPAHSGGRLCHTILVLFHIFFSFSLGVFPQPLKAVP